MSATPDANSEHLDDLVRAVIALNPYRKALTPLLDDITRLALSNTQIKEGLHRIAERSKFTTVRRLRKADLGTDGDAIFNFLEHVRFASPAFLSSVGEGQSS